MGLDWSVSFRLRRPMDVSPIVEVWRGRIGLLTSVFGDPLICCRRRKFGTCSRRLYPPFSAMNIPSRLPAPCLRDAPMRIGEYNKSGRSRGGNRSLEFVRCCRIVCGFQRRRTLKPPSISKLWPHDHRSAAIGHRSGDQRAAASADPRRAAVVSARWCSVRRASQTPTEVRWTHRTIRRVARSPSVGIRCR
ncbi:hypothetical protein CLV65_0220 [Pseudoscardovia suis]|uniref:Uncharacterized protein n=1 Tax=Pseudoscardovia suis TaxID=987063 RepID=A0A261EYY4_9BIFI|nr:hypothetical protein PSSU_0669 [Pseudoscardovia suis]PJJ69515.1 hypothetical protein CLV65_0220 [Pseudoscardovia suis]